MSRPFRRVPSRFRSGVMGNGNRMMSFGQYFHFKLTEYSLNQDEARAVLENLFQTPDFEMKFALTKMVATANSRQKLSHLFEHVADSEMLIRLLNWLQSEEFQLPLLETCKESVLREIANDALVMLICKELEDKCHEENERNLLEWFLYNTVILKADLQAGGEDCIRETVECIVQANQGSTGKFLRLLAERLNIPTDTTRRVRTGERAILNINDVQEPGGRHDNDHMSIADIAVVPTIEELQSKETPFLTSVGKVLAPSDQDEFGASDMTILQDAHFRLLREDMMRSAVETLKLLTSFDLESNFSCLPREVRSNVLRNVVIKDVLLDRVSAIEDMPDPYMNDKANFLIHKKDDSNQDATRRVYGPRSNICLIVGFGWPQSGSNVALPKKKSHRKDYWEDKARRILSRDSLVCLVDKTCTPLLVGKVVWRDSRTMAKRKTIPCVGLQVDWSESVFENLLPQISKQQDANLHLVTICKDFFSREYVLQRLQKDIDVSASLVSELVREKFPCSYCQLPIQDDRYKSARDTYFSQSENMSPDELQTITLQGLGQSESVELDGSQREAVACCLTQQVSLIQGPPGTGKTYIGSTVAKLLLDKSNCHQHGEMGVKILVVCLTNHALDQFLETLVPTSDLFGINDVDDSRIVRIGGRSRSQTMQKYNLVEQARKNRSCEYAQLFRASMCEMENARLTLDEIRRSLKRGFDSAHNPGRMNERQWSEMLQNQMQEAEEQVAHASKILQQMFKVSQARALEQAQIIGCTTHGAAKHNQMIQHAGITTLLVEEAAEVLESHVVASLVPTIQHVVLIGDHKQLRPRIDHHDLGIEAGEYDLNISLFERLVSSGFPHVALRKQHRMRPEISKYIKMLTYEHLENGPNVDSQEASIKGLQTNVAFIHHAFPEAPPDEEDLLSKCNENEAQMVISFVRYILQQGYSDSQITVLTPYLGQLRKLVEGARAMEQDSHSFLFSTRSSDNDELAKWVVQDIDEEDSSDNDESDSDTDYSDSESVESLDISSESDESNTTARNRVRLATIDNYQGEENDIVIVSLVRSNQKGLIGFMNQNSRINVMLSRAKQGMYLIGNSQTFENSSDNTGREIWGKLLSSMRDDRKLFNGVPTKCQIHKTEREIRSSEEFFKHCPHGGCMKICKHKLPCGHDCPLICHPYSLEDHHEVESKQEVSEICDQSHLAFHSSISGESNVCKLCKNKGKTENPRRWETI